MERFRVRARPLCDHTERANVDWNRSLIVLHEFAKIEQHGDNLGWNRRAPQRGFQRSNENFAVTLVQLRPTRDKRGTEQISGETRLNLREFTARSKGRERRALQQVESESTHPLEPILLCRPLATLPSPTDGELVHRETFLDFRFLLLERRSGQRLFYIVFAVK